MACPADCDAGHAPLKDRLFPRGAQLQMLTRTALVFCGVFLHSYFDLARPADTLNAQVRSQDVTC